MSQGYALEKLGRTMIKKYGDRLILADSWKADNIASMNPSVVVRVGDSCTQRDVYAIGASDVELEHPVDVRATVDLHPYDTTAFRVANDILAGSTVVVVGKHREGRAFVFRVLRTLGFSWEILCAIERAQ